MVMPKSINSAKVSNLQICSQNIRGLDNKIDELIINWENDVPHIFGCRSIIYQWKLFRP
jgi:hypothetical protein